MSTAMCQDCGAPLDTSSGKALCPACMLRDVLNTAEGDEMGITLPTAPVLPRAFGNYVLLEEIGRGGMGVVYAARQTGLDRTVAVKLLLSGVHASETAMQRFHTEAAAAARLQHPEIVEIHEYGELDGQPYYVMDLVAGRNLAQVCNGRPMDAPRAAAMLHDLADAVHYANQQGILHRDLKPSNVLVDERDRPRITDFGLARRLDDANSVTQTGEMLGSPGYAAPEQVAGRVQEIGTHTDVYGLGAVLYHLLTGRAPFNASTPTETLRLVLENDPVAPRLLNPAVPRDLETICLKCLAKEPMRRYGTAAEVVEELSRFLENRPIRARPPSIVYRAHKFAGRHRTGVAAVAVVIVALTAGLTLALFGLRRAVEQQRAADDARARSQVMVNFIMQKSLPQQMTLGRRRAMIESVETAVHYFEDLPAQMRDRETIRAHAKALDLLSKAYGYRWWRFLSTDSEASRAAIRQAAVMWRQLAESDPSDADAMAAALFDEYMSWRENQTRPNLQHDPMIGEYLRRYRDLAARFPENVAVQVGLARMLRLRVYDRPMSEDPSEAVTAAQEAGRIIDALLEEEPGDADLLLERTSTAYAQALAFGANGDLKSRDSLLEEAVRIGEGLLAKDPTNLSFLGQTAMMTRARMWNATSVKQQANSARSLREYASTLISLDPEDPEWRVMDAVGLYVQAAQLKDDRRFREGLQSINLALERWESVPEGSFDRSYFASAISLAGDCAAAAREDALAESMRQRLQDEFMARADEMDRVEDRLEWRCLCLYFQAEIVDWMGKWNELEHLTRQMLDEAERRVPDAPDTTPIHPAYRAGAQAMLGRALVRQGRAAEAVPVLEDAVAYFRTNMSMWPFVQFPPWSPWEAAEDLARALQQTGDREHIIELLDWSYERMDAFVKTGAGLASRVRLAQCAWELAEALDANDADEAARRHEVLARADEILNDPETVSRLTPEEQKLRAQIADALTDLPADARGM